MSSLWKKLRGLPVPDSAMLKFEQYDHTIVKELPPEFKAGEKFTMETVMTLDGLNFRRIDIVTCPAEAMRDGKVRLRFVKGKGWTPVPWEDEPEGLVWRHR